jgi:hypothetical protein
MFADVLKWLRSKRVAAATDEAGRLASLVRRLGAIMNEVHAIEQRESIAEPYLGGRKYTGS